MLCPAVSTLPDSHATKKEVTVEKRSQMLRTCNCWRGWHSPRSDVSTLTNAQNLQLLERLAQSEERRVDAHKCSELATAGEVGTVRGATCRRSQMLRTCNCWRGWHSPRSDVSTRTNAQNLQLLERFAQSEARRVDVSWSVRRNKDSPY
jgi:5-methylcytosine-specific restriction endonuclease McrA